MARRGRPTPVIELSDIERETLERWVRRHSSAQALALALRSRLVLACAAGQTNVEIAGVERVTRRRCRSGGTGSSPIVLRGWSMRLARGRNARSRTRRSKR